MEQQLPLALFQYQRFTTATRYGHIGRRAWEGVGESAANPKRLPFCGLLRRQPHLPECQSDVTQQESNYV